MVKASRRFYWFCGERVTALLRDFAAMKGILSRDARRDAARLRSRERVAKDGGE